MTPEQLAALAREAVYAWDPDTDPARPDGTTSHAELVARAQDTGSSVLSLQRQPARLDVDFGDERSLLAAALEAIVERNDPPAIFTRAGELTRVLDDDRGRPILRHLDDAGTAVAIMAACRFTRTSGTGDKVRTRVVDQPRSLARNLRALGHWPGLPILEAVTEAPTLRPDGTVLDRAGYDAASLLLYRPEPGLRIPPIPARPSQAEAQRAGERILELFADFPFATQADRANAVALTLTPLIRPAVGLCPLAIVTAPIKGSGKGKLANVGALIATGKPASVYATHSDDAELRKAIGALLLRGSTFIMLDEATELRSPQLAAVLTAETYTMRVLGRSEMAHLPQRATWVAAGNNVSVGGDLDRRSYRIRLDPHTARPWTRSDFCHPELEDHVTSERGTYLAPLLTMARAWWAAGRPAGPAPTLGSFTAWTATTAGILHHAGIPGFLDNLAEHYADSDAAADEWEAFLRATRHATAGQPFTVARLCGLLEGDGELRGLLPDDLVDRYGGKGFTRALGHALKGRRDTRHGDDALYLTEAGKDRTNVNQWRIHDRHAAAEVQG